MDRMEQRVRDSLRSRADDVEPTPELWDEVGHRIARRQRWRVSAWALAGATAVAVGVLVVPGLVGGVITPPQIEPVGPPDESAAEDPVDAPDEVPGEEPGEAPEEEVDEVPEEDPGLPGVTADVSLLEEPTVAVFERALVLLTPDGERSLVSLPEEGEGRFLSVAVRPGSTVDDLTIVTTTAAEGFHDVRWTRVVDGEVVVAHEAFEDGHAPAAATSDTAGLSPAIWSPDGDTVAWFDHHDDGSTTLRTVGWEDGPGTGRTADDNASFDLGSDLPSGATPNDWYAIHATRGQIRATMPDSTEGWYAIELERQADGALAMDAGVRTWGIDEPEIGTVGAVGGETDDAAPRWVVRLGPEGSLLSDLALGRRIDLPEDLLPGTGLADVWVRPHGEDGAIVGSRSTARSYLVDADRTVSLLSERTQDLDGFR